jgi:protein-arginine kinase activator protein McsA
MEQLSDNSSWATQNSNVVRKALNQDFINWASDTKGGFTEVVEVLEGKNTHLQDAWVQEYVGVLRSQMENSFHSEYAEAQNSVINKISSVKKVDLESSEKAIAEDYYQMGQFNGLSKSSVEVQGKSVVQHYENASTNRLTKISDTHQSISRHHEALQSKIDQEDFVEKGMLRRVIDKAGNIPTPTLPFWLNSKGED